MRDNVVGSPRRLQEFEIRPDSRRLVDEAKRLGFLVWIVTNQPDIERCLLDPAVLERMHDQLKATLPIDGIEVCPSADDCNPRRKPHPGMLLEIADRCEVDLARSYIIGDGEKDIQAGRAAGVETILFETSYNSSIHGTADHNCRLLKEILATLRLGEGRMG
jgi:D-glycero-D-manno-heptose 1,7-bisphosphate phosphatase